MTEKKYQEWLSDQLDEKRDQIKKRENELENGIDKKKDTCARNATVHARTG